MHHSAQKLDALFQISQKMGGQYELQELLDLIITKAVKVLRARTGSLMLIEPYSGRLVMRAVVGFRSDIMRTMKLRVGEGVTGQCALHAGPVLVTDTTRHLGYIEAIPGTLSELAVPLMHEGKGRGVVNVDSERLSAFTKQDLKLLVTFASWAAVAIRMAKSCSV